MRAKYPYCLLIGDNSANFYEICRSLRFSTHCNYLVLSPKPPFDMEKYAHMQWQSLNNFHVDELSASDDVLFILCHGRLLDFRRIYSHKDLKLLVDKYLYLIKSGQKEMEYNNKHAIEEIKTTYLNKYIMLIEEKLHESFLNDDIEEIRLEFILDYEGILNFLGGVKRNSLLNDKCRQLISSTMHKALQINNSRDKCEHAIKNQLISLNIHRNKLDKKLNTTLEINQIGTHWANYRATGINLPLILIQNLLKRKITTYYFVDPKNIELDTQSMEIFYKFNFDTVYFDLDETLIWKGEPLKDIVEILTKLRDKYPLKLITRHKLSIQNTLTAIGLETDMFKEIIPVLPEQKKSSFITGNSLFIDNEFPERLDVLLNCKIPVLDLDQIDFLRIY